MIKTIFIPLACVALIAVWQLLDGEAPSRPRIAHDETRASSIRSPFDSSIERARLQQAHPIQARHALGDDPGLASFVKLKYGYLNVEGEALREALGQREALAIRLNTLRQEQEHSSDATVRELEQEIALADERVRSLMHPADYAEYTLLRDANQELHALREYAGGIDQFVPLTAAQERDLLFAKLTYKDHFKAALANTALDREDLPTWQRMHAFERVAHAARQSHRYFLQQARQSLHSEDQFALLSNYETTELERELERLHLRAMRR